MGGFGRITVAGALLLLLNGHDLAVAQQQSDKPSSMVNEGAGVAVQAPAPDNDGGDRPDGQQPPPADAPEAPAAKDQLLAEPPCGPRCQAAEEREETDVSAQVDMAESTRRIVTLTEGQLWVGGFGIALLLVTIRLTYRATNEAIAANRIARDTAKQQLRAYLTPEVEVDMEGRGGVYLLNIVWRNTGQTPAKQVRTFANTSTLTAASLPKGFDYPNGSQSQSPGIASLGGGQPLHAWTARIPFATVQRMSLDIQKMYIWGSAEYTDIFPGATRRRTEFCYELAAEEIGDRQFMIGTCLYGPHNGMDETCHKKPETDSSGERAHRPGP